MYDTATARPQRHGEEGSRTMLCSCTTARRPGATRHPVVSIVHRSRAAPHMCMSTGMSTGRGAGQAVSHPGNGRPREAEPRHSSNRRNQGGDRGLHGQGRSLSARNDCSSHGDQPSTELIGMTLSCARSVPWEAVCPSAAVERPGMCHHAQSLVGAGDGGGALGWQRMLMRAVHAPM
jgi:hypothetical protein